MTMNMIMMPSICMPIANCSLCCIGGGFDQRSEIISTKLVNEWRKSSDPI